MITVNKKLFIEIIFLILVVAGILFVRDHHNKNIVQGVSSVTSPAFSQYPISTNEAYIGNPASIQYAGNFIPGAPGDIGYKQIFSKDYADQLHLFAGHYSIIDHFCGTDSTICLIAIVDRKTGVIYPTNINGHGSFKVSNDSRLLIATPFEDSIHAQYTADGRTDDFLATKFYEWTGTAFRFLGAYKSENGHLYQVTLSDPNDPFASITSRK